MSYAASTSVTVMRLLAACSGAATPSRYGRPAFFSALCTQMPASLPERAARKSALFISSRDFATAL